MILLIDLQSPQGASRDKGKKYLKGQCAYTPHCKNCILWVCFVRITESKECIHHAKVGRPAAKSSSW